MYKKSTVKLMTIKEVARTGILTEYSLRLLVKQNKVPMIKAGKKVLINYDALVIQLENLSAENWQKGMQKWDVLETYQEL